MQRMRLGLRVFDVRDLSVGDVTALLGCCFEVRGESGKFNLTQPSIFNVTDSAVMLICNQTELRRYACLIHGTVP
jgi:hypothetical protein